MRAQIENRKFAHNQDLCRRHAMLHAFLPALEPVPNFNHTLVCPAGRSNQMVEPVGVRPRVRIGNHKTLFSAPALPCGHHNPTNERFGEWRSKRN